MNDYPRKIITERTGEEHLLVQLENGRWYYEDDGDYVWTGTPDAIPSRGETERPLTLAPGTITKED